jgi:predicted permease
MHLRHLFRTLLQSRGYSILAITMLAVCIGPATAMFSIVDSVFFKRISYPDAARIVEISERLPDGTKSLVAPLNYIDWDRQNTVFERMAARTYVRENLSDGTRSAVILGSRVTASYFDVFHVTPALGRLFTPDEQVEGRNNVIILNHALWLRQFGGDSGVVGRAVRVGGESYTVVGVLSADDPLERDLAEYWRPLTIAADERTRGFHVISVSARLKANVSIAEAQAAMTVLAGHLAELYPDSNKDIGIVVSPYLEAVIGPQLRTSVLLWTAAVMSLFLIGLANLINLSLARTSARLREIAIRMALGAAGGRIATELLIENMVLAFAGSIAGFALATAIVGIFRSAVPAGTIPREANVILDIRALMFTVAIAAITGIVCGIIPALRSVDAGLASGIYQSNRITYDPKRKRLQRTFVILQVALSLVLLISSTSLMQSFARLSGIDLGFDESRMLMMRLSIPLRDFVNSDAVIGYINKVESDIRKVPGVRTVAATSALPLSDWVYGMYMQVEGRQSVSVSERPVVGFKMISPDYFDAVNLKVLSGRKFSDMDGPNSLHVAVINTSLSKKYFGDANPLGQHLLIPAVIPGHLGVGSDVTWEVVGVVSDEKVNLKQPVSPGVYVPIRQSLPMYVMMVVRTDGPAATLENSVRNVIRSTSTDQAIDRIVTGSENKGSAISTNRQQTVMLTTFTALATLLAACGIYGLISFILNQRVAEIGIRMALGSTRAGIVILFMREVLSWTFTGVATGLLLSVAAIRLLNSVLFAASGENVFTFAMAIGTLVAVAGLASWLPLRKASRLDPMTVLRGE